ncbi:MAG TPA: DUF4386 domain-containing protein [Pyrinomonadaceae bacterium]|nr:DUF4386 domain-containing protein [Pyrinomonadaceae bacterium]
MKSTKSSGRTIGILLLLQLAAGLTVPFILLRPIVAGSPSFLIAAAENSFQIRSAVLLSFVGGALTISLGITALPVFRRYSNATALWFLVVCVVSCTLDIVHNATVLSMLSFSNKYVTGGAANPELYEAIGAAVASMRRWAHVTQLVAIGGWLFVFYSSLLRFVLIPRALAALGLIGVALQFTGVTLMMFLGYRVIAEMAMPLLPIQITVAVWLMVKGFGERRHPVGAEA